MYQDIHVKTKLIEHLEENKGTDIQDIWFSNSFLFFVIINLRQGLIV